MRNLPELDFWDYAPESLKKMFKSEEYDLFCGKAYILNPSFKQQSQSSLNVYKAC